MKRKRYFSDDDLVTGVSPSRLKRLGKGTQAEYLRWWFDQMFDDPANDTPYMSSEGGYLYIWGGPYDAKQELFNEFGDLVSEEVIDQVAVEFETGGTVDWAPSAKHPDRTDHEDEQPDETDSILQRLNEIQERLETGIAPQYGNQQEIRNRISVLRAIELLEVEIGQSEVLHGQLGHNNPPQEHQISREDLVPIRNAVAEIRTELTKEAPDAKLVVISTSSLRVVGNAVKRHIDTAAHEFSKNLGGVVGKLTGVAIAAQVSGVTPKALNLLEQVTQLALHWLSHVTLPF